MRRLRWMVLGLALTAAGAAVHALPADAQTPFPDAAELIDRYVEARGGRDAILAPNSVRTRGKVVMQTVGAEGTMEMATQDGRMVMTMEIPGMGAMRSGFDGTVGWSVDEMMGPRLLEGGELDAMRDMAHPLAELRDASLFAVRETVERREMAEEPCWLVRLEWRSGRETLECYHVDTALAIATIETQESPMGAMEVTTYVDEYRETDGVLMPVRVTQEMMGQRMIIMTVDEMVHDDVDPSELEPPAAIRALMDG